MAKWLFLRNIFYIICNFIFETSQKCGIKVKTNTHICFPTKVGGERYRVDSMILGSQSDLHLSAPWFQYRWFASYQKCKMNHAHRCLLMFKIFQFVCRYSGKFENVLKMDKFLRTIGLNWLKSRAILCGFHF